MCDYQRADTRADSEVAPAPGLTRRVRCGLVLLGTLTLLLLANGCASVAAGGGGSDPENYNLVTGYPAVGSQRWLGW